MAFGKSGTKMTRGKRVVCAILVFILSFSALSMACSVVVYRVMFGRMDQEPLPYRLQYENLDAHAYPRQPVQFPSGENGLQGYVYPAKEPWGMVIVAHGIHAGASAHLAETVYFLDHGLSVLNFDATGVGESPGDTVVGLSQSKRDVTAAVRFAAEQYPDLPVFLYGHSMGAYGVLAALEEVEASAVVCVSGFRSPVELMYRGAKEYVGILADVEYPFLLLHNRLVFGSDADVDAALAAVRSGVPVLVAYGSEDAVIPPEVLLNETVEGENITHYPVTEAYRNGHTGLWLSAEAAAYVHILQEELEATGGLSAAVDLEKATELDEGFMTAVLELYRSAVK